MDWCGSTLNDTPVHRVAVPLGASNRKILTGSATSLGTRRRKLSSLQKRSSARGGVFETMGSRLTSYVRLEYGGASKLY